MSGALATQTPPWPTAMPEGMFRPSAKIVTLSYLPSPFVDSSTLIRSLPGPALRRGYSMLSVIQIRPRSSKVMATGLTMSGSAATSSTWKPAGTTIFLIAALGDSGGVGGLSWLGGSASFWARPGQAAQLLHGPDVQLADALLRDAELFADLLQRHAGRAVFQAGPHADDLPLARVQVLQEAVDLVRGLLGRGQDLVFVGARVLGGL